MKNTEKGNKYNSTSQSLFVINIEKFSNDDIGRFQTRLSNIISKFINMRIEIIQYNYNNTRN